MEVLFAAHVIFVLILTSYGPTLLNLYLDVTTVGVHVFYVDL